jgi:phytanoyl-CoA hydroxylase
MDPVRPLRLTDGEIRFYREYGFLLIPGLLAEPAAATLHDEVMELMHAIGGFEASKLRQSHEYLAGSAIHRLVDSVALRDIASQLMGGSSSVYLPFTAVKGVAGGMFHFHQDNQYTLFDDGLLGGINLWFALMPMTPENGCLMMVPRSHTSGTLESEASGDGDSHRKVKYEPSDFLPIRMRAGDCVAFTRLTVHGSGPNVTDRPRVGYAMQYYRNDVHWVDRQTGEKKLLTEHPRYRIAPVGAYSVPKGRVEGH